MSRASISCVAIFSATLIAILVLSPTGMLSRCFGLRPLVIVGRYSYCMYVIHLVVISHLHNVEAFVAPGRPLGFFVSGAALYLFTFLIAAMAWRLIEEPLLGLKRFFMYQTSDLEATGVVPQLKLGRPAPER